MTDVATKLAGSRHAHQLAKGALAKGQPATDHFQTALDLRLEAERIDPNRFDASWLEDAWHRKMPGETGRRYHRIPGKTPAQVAKDKHDELVAYFRQRLAPPAPLEQPALTDAEIVERVVVPTEWRTTQDGATPCATCGHTQLQHTIVGQPLGQGPCHSAGADAFHNIVPCECEAYQPTECRHAWVKVDDERRKCDGCGEQQQLFVKLRLEATEAYRQLQKEQGR